MQMLNIFHVLVAIALVALILVQRGAGATAGAAFGSGASGTVFGSRGAGNFLTRTTSWLAIAFFAISLTMAVMAARVITAPQDTDLGVMGNTPQTEVTESPALPVDSGSDLPVIDNTADSESDLPQPSIIEQASDLPDEASQAVEQLPETGDPEAEQNPGR